MVGAVTSAAAKVVKLYVVLTVGPLPEGSIDSTMKSYGVLAVRLVRTIV